MATVESHFKGLTDQDKKTAAEVIFDLGIVDEKRTRAGKVPEEDCAVPALCFQLVIDIKEAIARCMSVRTGNTATLKGNLSVTAVVTKRQNEQIQKFVNRILSLFRKTLRGRSIILKGTLPLHVNTLDDENAIAAALLEGGDQQDSPENPVTDTAHMTSPLQTTTPEMEVASTSDQPPVLAQNDGKTKEPETKHSASDSAQEIYDQIVKGRRSKPI